MVTRLALGTLESKGHKAAAPLLCTSVESGLRHVDQHLTPSAFVFVCLGAVTKRHKLGGFNSSSGGVGSAGFSSGLSPWPVDGHLLPMFSQSALRTYLDPTSSSHMDITLDLNPLSDLVLL